MSDPPATLRLGLAAGGLRQARQHPLLNPRQRPQRSRQNLRLLGPVGADSASGTLCLAVEDGGILRQEIVSAAGSPAKEGLLTETEWRPLASGTAEVTTARLEQEGRPLQVQFVKTILQHDGREITFEEVALLALDDASPEMLTALGAQLARDLSSQWSGTTPLLAAAEALGVYDPQPLRAGQIPYTMPDDASAVIAFAAVAWHCLVQFDANLLPVLRDRDVEGVHQMRVALRRLRSALGVFEPILPAETLKSLLDGLHWLNQPLGRKRDLDVFLHETLLPLRRAKVATTDLKHLCTVIEDRRQAAQQALDSALRSSRCAAWRLSFAHCLDGLERQIAESGDAELQARAGQPAARFAAAVLQKRRKKVKKLGQQHESLDTEALHRLRIRAKKLRYAAEFFRPLFARKDARKFLAALADLQDCLGALNDAAVGTALMRDVVGPPGKDPAAAAIIGWYAGRQELQLSELGKAWEAFADIKPFWKGALED